MVSVIESSQTPQASARRAVLGFALVPLLPGFYATLMFAQPLDFPIGVALSYPCALLPGLPLFWLARRRNWLAWWQCGLGGLLCSVPAVVAVLGGRSPQFAALDLVDAWCLLAWGAFAGLCFWLIAVAGSTPLSLRSLLGQGPH